MTYDADTLCVTLGSPEYWAEKAALPETCDHFKRVAAGLLAPAPQPPHPARIIPDSMTHIDPRCASELGL